MEKTSGSNGLQLPQILLASRSPRRANLLSSLGFPFQSCPPGVEELPPSGREPENLVRENAKLKVQDILTHGLLDRLPLSVVIGADTIVVIGDQTLGKPQDRREALRMLSQLSGNTHEVITGICLAFGQREARVSTSRSLVTFRYLSESEMNAYCGLEEPYDKAGAYAVQGLGCLFIEKIVGSYTNVMGLPIELLLVELEQLTGVSAFEWFEKRIS